MSLKVDGVTCGYGDITVIWDVSLEARDGEVLALLGRNGAGKTTLLNAISGLIVTSAGSVSIGGKDITSTPPYRRVKHGLAFVQEGKRVFRQRTVEENLVLGAFSAKLNKSKLAVQLEAAYGRFPVLHDKRMQTAGTLSGGQQQMLSIAQALIREPRYLLLDEPSAGLAPTIVADVYAVIASLRDEGMCILLVEQAVGWAASVADRIAVLDLGRQVYEGAPTGAEAKAAISKIELGAAMPSAESHSHE